MALRKEGVDSAQAYAILHRVQRENEGKSFGARVYVNVPELAGKEFERVVNDLSVKTGLKPSGTVDEKGVLPCGEGFEASYVTDPPQCVPVSTD